MTSSSASCSVKDGGAEAEEAEEDCEEREGKEGKVPHVLRNHACEA